MRALTARLSERLRRLRLWIVDQRTSRGSATAEYAMVMIAACSFAALLMAILRSGQMHDVLVGLVHRALGGA